MSILNIAGTGTSGCVFPCVDQVNVNPPVTDRPCRDKSPDPIEEKIPDLYLSYAATRAMTKKAILSANHSILLKENYIKISGFDGCRAYIDDFMVHSINWIDIYRLLQNILTY